MVTPLEQAAMAAFVNIVMGKLFEVLGLVETYTMLRHLRPDSESLRDDLRMIAAAVDDELTNSRGARRTAVAREYSREMRGLMHDVEDCIERFAHRVTCKEGASRLRRAAHGARTVFTCYRFAAEIKALKKRVQAASERVLKPLAGDGGQPSGSRPPAADHAARNPVGIVKPKGELLALLGLDHHQAQQQQQAKVVAIVGFGGVGKTTLARAAYDDPAVADAFPCRAWVDVRSLGHANAEGILEDIGKQLLGEQQYSKTLGKQPLQEQQYSKTSLTKYLKDQRCLIVIDDIDGIDEEQWDTIKSALHEIRKDSRIVVTTTIGSTANKRSNESNGHVYKMRTLGTTDSRTIALCGRCAPELVQGGETLLKKCDGLPLALVSVARQLNGEDDPTGKFCSELSSRLGSFLEREDAEPNFARLRDVLTDNYTSLSDLTVRTCLLYLGIFPMDHHLQKNVIIRRWLAEGYARSEDITLGEESVANGNFKTFIDRNIIQPVDKRNNAEVKTCKTHGIVHEFLLHKSMCEKFSMSFDAPRDKVVRHLFVDGDLGTDTNPRTTLDMDLSRVRSLTVRGSAGDATSDFGKYKLMRVLDLEKCRDMNDRHLRKIHKLWNLRYLSLSSDITKLPKEIAKLKLLETLALAKTEVSVLPVEVIGLPSLTNLIGKFKLSDQDWTRSNDLEELSKKSKLVTLAGFVADGRQRNGFLQLMIHMKNLKKVKIWCESTGDDGDIKKLNDDLLNAIKRYIKPSMGAGDVRSLSIDFQKLPPGSLHALRGLHRPNMPSQETYYLSSLKLHGDLSTSHEFVDILSGLTKLCLSSATMARNLLSALSAMPFLLYLTLIANEIEGFVIKVGAFQSLRRLRIDVQHQNPVLPEIEEGALPELVSFQLPFKHLDGPSSIKIRHLRKLQEIELHPKVSEPARQEWEAAARNHPNRLNVLFLSVDDLVGDEATNNPGVSPKESGHEEVVIQGKLANEAPGPSSVQHMPLSTCYNSELGSEMDDSAHHETRDSPIGPEEATLETSIGEQLQLDEPLEHTPVQTRQENSSFQSRQNHKLGSTSNHSGLPRDSEPPGEPVALVELTCRTGIQGRPAEEASKYSLVLTDQQGNYTFTELGPAGSCHTSVDLLNTSNGTLQFRANGDANDDLRT